MPIIPIGEFLPDAADLNNPGSVRVVNAFPGLTSYKPVPSFGVVTNALSGRPLGAIAARDKDGNLFQYAGDATKLYELSGMTWGDVSKVGGYATTTENRWELLQWKNKILATNLDDDPQQITMGDAVFSDLTTDFQCRHLAAVGNFVVAGNTVDVSDGAVPNRIRWSAFNNETDWTVSPVTLSDFRDLQAGGAVQGIVGGELGIVVLQSSTWRMSFAGAPTAFQLDEVLPGLGSLSRGGILTMAGTVYFPSEQGFVALTAGTQAEFIGAGKIDQFFRSDLDTAFLHRISGVADPLAGRLFWAYPGAGHTGGRPNRILVYDRAFKRWSLIEAEFEMLWRGTAAAVSLDDPDAFADNIDAVGAPSLDSSIYKGGSPELAAFDQSFGSGFFAGPPMTAEIETTEAELAPGRRALLTSFRAVVDGGTVTAQVGTRNDQADPVAFGPVLTKRPTGRFTPRDNARYHRARLQISGAWEDAIGIQVERGDAKPVGGRG